MMPLSVQMWTGRSEQHVMPCQGQHLLHPDTCKSFTKMQTAAQQDGVDMQIVSAFRGFNRQQAIWDQKWLGQRPVYTINGEQLDINKLSPLQKLHAILTWSALPGASRHHWGSDLDVYDKQIVNARQHDFQLISEEYEQGGPCFELSCWLDENAESFGFYRPYADYNGGVAPEAWHLSHKPVAMQISQQLTIKDLDSTIRNSTVQGKETILANLDQIFNQYTLNGERRE